MIKMKPIKRPTGRSHVNESFERDEKEGCEGWEEVDDVRSSKDICVLFEGGLNWHEAAGMALQRAR